MRLGHLFRPLRYARSLFRLRLKHDQFCPLSPILGGHKDFAHLFDYFGFKSRGRGLVGIDRPFTAVASGYTRDVAQNAVAGALCCYRANRPLSGALRTR